MKQELIDECNSIINTILCDHFFTGIGNKKRLLNFLLKLDNVDVDMLIKHTPIDDNTILTYRIIKNMTEQNNSEQ